MTQKKNVMSNLRRLTLRKTVAKRRAILMEQLQAVAQGYTSALFIFGPGGLGKSHMVGECLDGLCGKHWVHHTAYSTPKALMLSIMEAPSSIHVFEDTEKLYKTDVAASILRAACGAPRGKDRVVTYETADETLRCKFSGGIVIVSNEDLSRKSGPLAAIASRMKPIEWTLTIEERIAVMLDMADEGAERNGWIMTADECRTVAHWLVEEMTQGTTIGPVDIRTYAEHALPAFAQCRDEESDVDWRDVLRSKLSGAVVINPGRSDKTRQLEDLAIAIASRQELATTKDKVAFWESQTGLGQSIYYRHLKNGLARQRMAKI